MMDLSATNKEDAGDQDVKIHNKDMNNGNTISGFTDSQIEEAQKPTDTPANIPEKQKTKSKKRVSFFLCTSDHKDAHGLEERELSAESLDHVKNNQNEDAPEGPTLPTEHGTNNKCEKLGPIIKQSACDACDIRPQEVSGTLSNSGADQQMEVDQQVDGKEKTGLCEESNFVSVEGCISSAEIISQLDGAVAGSESCRENPGSEAQESLLPEGKVSCTSPLGSHGTATPTCSTVKDLLSVNLDFLLDSQLQNIFESNSLDRSPHKPSSLDVPCTSRGTKPVANVAHPNNAGDEMTVRICDPSKEEDATNVVCGLIKELSNLNRLVMSTHRDLDSFKRLKFQRYRQLGQHLPHRMNTTTNMRGAVKKKKRVLLGNARAPFDTCKAFLSSSDVSSAETSKAVATHSVADAQDHHGRGQSLKNETYPDAKNP
ncbi:break repair meiotic recombinase recruitment factor 1 [Paroedura picta]|uniref:break repair meiotic recombinase recruitment factor 1 n=1 Tax=Paroedura picta TaxID=143630 RepID=UPI00405706EB